MSAAPVANTTLCIITQVKDVYYPEVEGLIKRMTGASGVRVMMHGLRKGKIERE